MDEISAFWAGAQDVGQRAGVDLPALAARAGGFQALEAHVAEVLRDAAYPPRVVEAWLAARPRRTRGRALRLADPEYPTLLAHIECPPPVLFVEGDLESLTTDAVAVVGTRVCTPYGAGVARQLATGLAAGGCAVVSGLARGIDRHAHEAALAVGRTVAVLGHGLNTTAPSSHRSLRQAILRGGGLIVSSWPDEVLPMPFRFPIRNAWISGLSKGVIVVEAPVRSGACITARAAAFQGRDIWVVPGPLGAPQSAGCLELVGEVNAQVIADVGRLVATLTKRPHAPAEAWLETLLRGSSVDEAARVAGRSTVETLVLLTELELAGAVVRLPGQRYAPGGSLRWTPR